MAAVRLYVDEDASESAVIAGLRARGIDLLTTAESKREGTTDEEQLAYADCPNRVANEMSPSYMSRQRH